MWAGRGDLMGMYGNLNRRRSAGELGMGCGHHVSGGGAAPGGRNPTSRTGMLGPEADPPLLQNLQHDPLVLLARDAAQDRADRVDSSSMLPDHLADLSFANSEFVDERRLSSDFPDHDLIRSVHKALGDVFDEALQLASARTSRTASSVPPRRPPTKGRGS